MATEAEIAQGQLAQGNRGAFGYFTKRVELMLADDDRAADLQRFLRKWWPAFKRGMERRAYGQSTESKTSRAPEVVGHRERVIRY